MNTLRISPGVAIPSAEIDIAAIRAQGAGGQKVNKASTAVHLRFDIRASSLPEFYKERLLALRDSHITDEGIVVIKAQRFRSLDRNREDALCRLGNLIRGAAAPRKARKATKPTRGSVMRRLDSKKKHGERKRLRSPIAD